MQKWQNIRLVLRGNNVFLVDLCDFPQSKCCEVPLLVLGGKPLKALKKIAIGLAGFLIFFVLIGFFIIPPFVKKTIVKEVSRALQREVAIEAIQVNPLRLSLTIKGGAVCERDSGEVFFSFQELFLNLEVMSLFKRAVVVKEATLKAPFLHLVRNKDESYNISDLFPAEDEETSFLFSVNNIRVIDGKVVFQDTPKAMTHLVEAIHINLPFVSNISYYIDTFITPSFAAVINGTPYTLQGRTKPFETSYLTEVDISFKDLHLPTYLSYIPWKINGRIPSAFLDANAKITFRHDKKDGQQLLLDGQFLLKNGAMDDGAGNPVLRLPYVAIDFAASNILNDDIRLHSLVVRDPEVHLQRTRQGEWNILSLWEEVKKEKKPEEKAGTSVVIVKDFALENGTLHYRDDGQKTPFRFSLRDIQIKGTHFSTLPREEGQVAMRFSLPARGAAELSGSFGVEPVFTARLDVNVSQLILPPFQAYSEQLFNVKIAKGNLSAQGQWQLEKAPEKEIAFRFSGDASLNRFSFLDTNQYNDLLSGDALTAKGVELRYPFALRVQDMIFHKFYSRLVINEDGMLNVQRLLKEQQDPSASASQEGEQADQDISIARVIFREGTVSFLDRSIHPNFSMKLTDVAGRVSGLSSRDSTQGKVTIKGKWDHYAPVDIKGQLNPLGRDFFMDLKADVREMDLPPVTPYAGKYFGYEIEKGKLSFAAQYRIDKRKLDSTNQIFLDQLTFGKKVASPDATTLPVSLAVSLLKDRHGQIKLDIPVYGTLDDPEFNVWKIIWKVIENLLIKAAASPFSLLGSVFGAGEELSNVEFNYGNDALNDEMMKRIHILSKALAEHHDMKLEIEGYVDPDNDREALKKKFLEREMKVLKFNSMDRRGKNIVTPEDVTWEKEEYTVYLRKIYEEKTFSKPRNMIGLEKTLTPEEMEKLICSHTVINDDDLRLLADQRAKNTKDAVLALGAVETGRVFIVSMNYAAPPPKEGLKKSRVDFRLR